MAKRRPKGGLISGAGGRKDDRAPAFMLTRGCAVVPDAAIAKYGRGFFERLNGGNTDVLSAGEVLAEYDADEA